MSEGRFRQGLFKAGVQRCLGTVWGKCENAVLPVAEKAQVKLALHPDDPPLSPVMGVSRIFNTIEGFERGLGRQGLV